MKTLDNEGAGDEARTRDVHLGNVVLPRLNCNTSNVTLINLGHGHHAIVDGEDHESVSRFKWFAFPHRRTVYAARHYKNGGKTSIQRMHRLILGVSDPGVCVDHIDGNGLNNRKSNLRIATAAQSRANSRKPKTGRTSKFKGVYWNKAARKFMAQIKSNGHQMYLGLFDRELEAARAYNYAALLLFGEFAKLNLVGD